MKHLILLRHAKSVHQSFDTDDFARTLNEKGRADVPKVAAAFSKLDLQPDIILCSTAARTRETLLLFSDAITSGAEIVYSDKLYHAPASLLFDLLSDYSQYNNIMLVGHNFGISQLANYLSETGASEMNTCGLYVLQFKHAIDMNKGKIQHYLAPGNI